MHHYCSSHLWLQPYGARGTSGTSHPPSRKREKQASHAAAEAQPSIPSAYGHIPKPRPANSRVKSLFVLTATQVPR